MKTLRENQMANTEGNGCFFAIPKALLLCGGGIPTPACINAQIEVAICWNDTEQKLQILILIKKSGFYTKNTHGEKLIYNYLKIEL